MFGCFDLDVRKINSNKSARVNSRGDDDSSRSSNAYSSSATELPACQTRPLDLSLVSLFLLARCPSTACIPAQAAKRAKIKRDPHTHMYKGGYYNHGGEQCDIAVEQETESAQAPPRRRVNGRGYGDPTPSTSTN